MESSDPKPPESTGSKPAISNDRPTIMNIFNLTALLFAFPAAALVNYSWIVIDNLPYCEAGGLLFVLFVFLFVEGASSRAYPTQVYM
jgi:hypothetical protein